MADYKIEVKPWMLKVARFNEVLNKGVPMPLLVMYGTKIGESPRMVKMALHGDLKQVLTNRCMHCGKVITNPVSQYFGMGPKCGGHNYVNPFKSEEDLQNAVAAYRSKLVNITWTGWIPLSAIVSIDDNSDILEELASMPFEVTPESEYLFSEGEPCPYTKACPVINARIDHPLKGTDDYSVFLSFKYNELAKDVVKSLGTHIWHSEIKEWEIDYKDFDTLQNLLPDFQFNVSNTEILPEPIETDDSDFKTTPMKHQTEGVEYGLKHNRWLLADEQGLGKTKQVLDLATIRKRTGQVQHCLIVCCVNSLKWNWVEEIEKHTDESCWILGMRKMKRTGRWAVNSNKDKIEDLDKLIAGDPEISDKFFLITNIESLRNPQIAEKLAYLCNNGVISMLAADESHRIKDTRTQQSQGLLQLSPVYRIAMTGTPLVNKPTDLFAILKWLGYQRYGFTTFRDHFCYLDEYGSIVGYKNIDQLMGQLDSIMLRRLKKEVLPELPEKIYINEYVELTDEQKDLYNQVIDDVVNDPDIAEQLNLDCQLAVKLRLRQVSGGIEPFNHIKKNPKLDRMEELVEEAVYSDTKVIIFSNWVKALNPAIKRLQKYNPVVISGDIDPAERQNAIHKFQNDDSVKVILCTIAAAGVGITLTAATEVIFLDEPFTNADKEQAIDRAHRIGTKSAVTVHTLMGHGTYDEHVHQIVLGKRDLSDAIVDKDALARMRIS